MDLRADRVSQEWPSTCTRNRTPPAVPADISAQGNAQIKCANFFRSNCRRSARVRWSASCVKSAARKDRKSRSPADGSSTFPQTIISDWPTILGYARQQSPRLKNLESALDPRGWFAGRNRHIWAWKTRLRNGRERKPRFVLAADTPPR